MLRKLAVTATLGAAGLLHIHHPVDAHNTRGYQRHHEDILDDLAHCEGGHNPSIVSKNGRYRGTFQFLLSTWRSMPERAGDPATHTYEEQKHSARQLIERSGWGQFPACSRMIGAR